MPWQVGQDALIVQHDDLTRQPVPGGTVIKAVVTAVSAYYVRAEYDDPAAPGRTAAAAFWAESGWTAWDGGFTWRLTAPEITAEPEDRSSPVGIFGRKAVSPNDKQYELRYEDGGTWRYQEQKTFDLETAITLANHAAGSGTRLCVTDPETDSVLWIGQEATR